MKFLRGAKHRPRGNKEALAVSWPGGSGLASKLFLQETHCLDNPFPQIVSAGMGLVPSKPQDFEGRRSKDDKCPLPHSIPTPLLKAMPSTLHPEALN